MKQSPMRWRGDPLKTPDRMNWFWIFLFKTREDYQRVKRSEQLTPQLIAGLYNVKPDFIHRIIWFDPANAVKNRHAARYYFPATSGTMMFMALSSMRRY